MHSFLVLFHPIKVVWLRNLVEEEGGQRVLMRICYPSQARIQGRWNGWIFTPFFWAPFLFYSYPSNIEIIFDFSDIITKIYPPFQNPGSALASKRHSTHVPNSMAHLRSDVWFRQRTCVKLIFGKLMVNNFSMRNTFWIQKLCLNRKAVTNTKCISLL